MSTEPLSGSCLCGAVRYEVGKPYLRFAHCYCGRCRKATGSSHATNLYVEPPQFSWTAGAELIRRSTFYPHLALRSAHALRAVAASHIPRAAARKSSFLLVLWIQCRTSRRSSIFSGTRELRGRVAAGS
jgi:Glutathione-dependent formaldehyde-activating enzyme